MDSIYDSLNTEIYEIRILYLQPGPPGSMIECYLEKKSLVDLPNYSALSYCWGDSADTAEILVNLVPIKVTINLKHALQRLRGLGVERVWADALCINQEDNQERSLQIRNMREIYSKAEMTFSWLGGRGEDCAVDGLGFLRKRRDWISQLSAIQGPKKRRGWAPKGRQSPDIEEILPHEPKDNVQPVLDPTDAQIKCSITIEYIGTNQDECDAQEPLPIPTQAPYASSSQCKVDCKRCEIYSSFKALTDLFNRDYWRRRWIIQEIAASENVCILCGQEWLLLEELYEAMSQCRRCPFWEAANEDSCTFFDIIMKLRGAYQGHEELYLGEIIPQTKDFRSRDPRDRIFAMLGICSDGSQLVPTPSYHQSPEGVSRDLTRSMLRRYQCFEFLLENHHPKLSPSNLPSWALGWSSQSVSSGFMRNPRDRYITKNLANWILRGSHGTLIMRGTILGTVAGVTTSISNASSAETPNRPIISPNMGINAKRLYAYYQTVQGVRDALSWCLARQDPTRTRFRSHTDSSVCKRYRVALHECSQTSRSMAQGDDVDASYLEHGIRRPGLDFRRWVCMNTEFLIDGKNLQCLLKECGLWYYAKLPLDFLLGRLILGAIIAGLLMCPIAFPVSDTTRSIMGISLFALSILSVFALLVPLWCLRRHWPRSYVLEPMEQILGRVVAREKLASCDTGMLAMVGDTTRPGDLICQLDVFRSPVTLRKVRGEGEAYELKGKAFPCFSIEDYYRHVLQLSETRPEDITFVHWRNYVMYLVWPFGKKVNWHTVRFTDAPRDESSVVGAREFVIQ